ncbi:MAG: hypothetical protein ACAH80_04435 [Alphaproteobacteria bacterium]
MEKKRPLLSVRPTFDSSLTLLQSLGVSVLGIFVLTILLGTFFYIILSFINPRAAGAAYWFFLIVSGFGVPIFFFELKKKAYQRTLFNFHEDYLEFQYFKLYLNRRRGRVRYSEITGIDQHASALQDHQRLTTIYISVPTMGYRRGGFAGLELYDLPQAKNYLTKITDIVEGRARQQAARSAPAAKPQDAAPAPQQQPQGT